MEVEDNSNYPIDLTLKVASNEGVKNEDFICQPSDMDVHSNNADVNGQQIVVSVEKGIISGLSFLLSYRLRGSTPEYNAMSIWDHIAYVQRLFKKESQCLNNCKGIGSCYHGPFAAEHVPFLSNKHLLFEIYLS